MTLERSRVRALVRAELEKRLSSSGPQSQPIVPALLEIVTESDASESDARKTCVIEPDRPCVNSGYCKKLGY